MGDTATAGEDILKVVGVSPSTATLARRAPGFVSRRAALLVAASDGKADDLAGILREACAGETDTFELYRRYRRFADAHYGGLDLWEVGKAQELLDVLSAGGDGHALFVAILTPPEDREDWAHEGAGLVSTAIH
jgi:hypothetical protein